MEYLDSLGCVADSYKHGRLWSDQGDVLISLTWALVQKQIFFAMELFWWLPTADILLGAKYLCLFQSSCHPGKGWTVNNMADQTYSNVMFSDPSCLLCTIVQCDHQKSISYREVFQQHDFNRMGVWLWNSWFKSPQRLAWDHILHKNRWQNMHETSVCVALGKSLNTDVPQSTPLLMET